MIKFDVYWLFEWINWTYIDWMNWT